MKTETPATPHPRACCLTNPRACCIPRARRLVLPALAVVYAGLLTFPGGLFAHHAMLGPFHVASDAPIDPALSEVLIRASAKLAKSPLYDLHAEHRLYLCNSPWRRRLLAPGGSEAFGTTHPLRRNTLLNRSDAAADRVVRDAPIHNQRSLSGVVAHERMHAALMDHFGLPAYYRLPSWKIEGYCDYIAADASFDPEEGRRLIREGRDDGSTSFRDFRAHMMVRYLLDAARISPDHLFAREFDEPELMTKVRASIDRLRF